MSKLESEAYQLSYIHFSFGEFLSIMQNSREGQMHVVRAKEILQPHVRSTSLLSWFPRIGIDINLRTIENTSVTGYNRINQLEKLAGIAQDHGDLESEKECLVALFDKNQRQPVMRRSQMHLTRLEEIEGHLSPHLQGQLSTRQLIQDNRGGQQSGSLVEWYTNHEQQYPASLALRHGQPPEYPDDDDFVDVPATLFYRIVAKTTAMLPLGITGDIIEAQADMALFKSNIDMGAMTRYVQHLNIDESLQYPSFFPEGDLLLCGKLLSRLRDSQRRHVLDSKTLALILQGDSFPSQSCVIGLTDDTQNSEGLSVAGKTKLDKMTAEDLNQWIYQEPLDLKRFVARIHAIESWIQHDDKFSGRSSSQTLILALITSVKIGWNLTQSQSDAEDDNLLVAKEFSRFLQTCNEDVQKRFPAFRFQCWNQEMLLKTRFDSDEGIDMTELSRRWHQASQILEEFQQSCVAENMQILSAIFVKIAKLDTQMKWQQDRAVIFSAFYDKADKCMEKLRIGLSALPGTKALEFKSKPSIVHFNNLIVIKEMQSSLYDGIYRLNYLEGVGNQNALLSELWNCIQKLKARAINDLLGLNTVIPKEIEQRISTSPTSRSIIEQWTKLRQDLSKKRSTNRPTIEIEQKIEDLEQQGKDFAPLTEVFSLARGSAAGLEDMDRLLDSMPPEQRSKIALIDWFEGLSGDTFEMIIYRHRTIPKWFRLGAALKTRVEEWVDRYPAAKDGQSVDWRAAWTEAQKLRALIQPIEQATEADDILVLCPTGILHRFPLHALKLCRDSRKLRRRRKLSDGDDHLQDNELTLLERNPVVFVPSMSLFRLSCFARMRSSSEAEHKAVIAAPIYQTSAPATDDLWDFLNCEKQNYCRGKSVTKANLISLCRDADFVHFYGHVHNHDAENPMRAHLLLATQSHDLKDDAICTGTHEDSAWFPASEILARLSLREGAHVNLIACDSGVNYAAAGDDMLGLIPALLMAGARSVCSTLWAVDEKMADEWIAQLIYAWTMARRRAATQQEERGMATPDLMINLAQCARTASLSLMGGADAAYRMRNWAPYVYHGFWDIHDGPH